MDYQAKTDWNYNDTVTEKDLNRIEAGLGDLHERLDKDKRQDIVLSPGVQIVNSKQNTIFRFRNIQGRMLINLMGEDGSGESLDNWIPYSQAEATVDRSVTMENLSSFKIKNNNTNAGVSQSWKNFNPGSYYLIAANMKNGSGIAKIHVNFSDTDNITNEIIISDLTGETSEALNPIFSVFEAPKLTSARVYLWTQGTPNSFSNINAVRIYEISEQAYIQLKNKNVDDIVKEYPYVDSIQGVKNPYIIRYGRNILPPFYQWTNGRPDTDYFNFDSLKLVAPYKVECLSKNSPAMIITDVRLAPHTVYTLSCATPTLLFVYQKDKYTDIKPYAGGALFDSLTFKTDDIVDYTIGLYLNEGSSNPITFENPILSLGDQKLLFKENYNNMLALETELLSDPISFSEYQDTTFEKNGNYYKLKRWGKYQPDQDLLLGPSGIRTSKDMKKIYINIPHSFVRNIGFATKFNGKVLKRLNQGSDANSADQFVTLDNEDINPNSFYISVGNSESGWGESYTPDLQEVRAFFMGWKMYDSSDLTGNLVYNRSDRTNKAWTPLASYNGSNYSGAVTSVPFTRPEHSALSYRKIRNVQTYKLIYMLDTPVIEQIKSEGFITLNEEENMIETGSGIIIREPIQPAGVDFSDPYVQINQIDFGTSLKYKMSRHLAVFRDNQKDFGWEVIRLEDGSSFGKQRLRKLRSEVDTNRAYSITYFVLNKVLSTPAFGIITDNEKSLLSILVESVQNATQRISILENEKAEKNIGNAAWSTPTLLNGWTAISGYRTGYHKLPNSNIVQLSGALSNGETAIGTVLFYLPKGYRPASSFVFSANSRTIDSSSFNSITLDVRASGAVLISFGTPYTGALTFETVFEAEQ